jgi:membrane-bound serine protease (ClpP class)
MIEFLLQPNIAYLTLVAVALLALMSLLTPGTGFFEIGALFAFFLAGWQVYNLEINAWALILIGLSVVPFWLAIRQARGQWYLAGAILALVLGSAFLFPGEVGWQPAVNPVIALVASTLMAGFLWLVTTKTLAAQRVTPAHDLGGIVGAMGVARTAIHQEGAVYVHMEDWSASSEVPIPAGTEVRVTGREGFVLHVEAVEQPESV